MKRLILFAALLFPGACTTTTTVNRFEAFAELGRGFEVAVDEVIDQASVSNVDANSQVLLNSRGLIDQTAQQRGQELIRQNTAIVESNKTYANLKNQSALLGDYFTALGALASFDGESAIGESAGSTVTALQSLSPSANGIYSRISTRKFAQT